MYYCTAIYDIREYKKSRYLSEYIGIENNMGFSIVMNLATILRTKEIPVSREPVQKRRPVAAVARWYLF